jgi:soluble lytic murein transglycosylase
MANFREGAKYFNTFYGQLSAGELKEENAPITLPEAPTITAEAVKKFTNSEEIRTLVTAHLAEQTSLVRIFFSHLRYRYTDTQQLTLLAELAASLGYNQSTVRIGKTAMSKDHPLAEYAYPVRFMPKFKPLRSIPENALIYAIARQESEFNEAIKSHAGARGLMQVMPRTLKGIARKYKIKWRVSWLTQRPAYNAAVGSAYVGDRHDEFGGSYIMTFAGFNAGPGRVRQWVREFGDPRSKDIDPIDWIERIPFSETRNYVQKVLANVQVYRARLNNGKVYIKSIDDLHRGKL